LLMLRYGTSVSLFGDVLPALLVFSIGLSMTVAPLTATVLADAREEEAGIASAVNNAIARTAGLVAVAAVGAVVASTYTSLLDQRLDHRLPASSAAAVKTAKRRTFGFIAPSAVPASERAFAFQAAANASRDAFHVAVDIGGGLLILAGLGGLALEGKRRTVVAAGECAGGTLSGAPRAAGECEPVEVGTGVAVGGPVQAAVGGVGAARGES
jgi:hypothetical protein